MAMAELLETIGLDPSDMDRTGLSFFLYHTLSNFVIAARVLLALNILRGEAACYFPLNQCGASMNCHDFPK